MQLLSFLKIASMKLAESTEQGQGTQGGPSGWESSGKIVLQCPSLPSVFLIENSLIGCLHRIEGGGEEYLYSYVD